MSNAPTLLTRSLTLPTFRLEALEAALKRLGKKAAKLGCVAPIFRVVAEKAIDVNREGDFPNMVSFSDVEITYEVLSVAGEFRFVAKIEAADMVDGVPRNKVSGINLTDEQSHNLITAPMVCEHCGIKRKRNACYSVQSNDGKVMMVGSSCLQAYMGIDPAAAVMGMGIVSAINEIGEDDEVWGRGFNAPRVMPLGEFAAATLSLVSKNGFVNAQAAEFGNQVKTGNDVVTLLLDNNPKLADWRSKMAPTDEHKVQAAAVIQRLTDRILPSYRVNPAALDQFSFKFGIVLNKGFVGVKDAQLAAAAIYFESGKVAKENVKGNIKRNELMPDAVEGQRLEFVGTIQSVKEVFSTFGTSLLVTFVSESGHIVKTFYSGKSESFNTGAKVNVKGTVKKLEVSEKWGSSIMISRAKIVA